MIEEVKSSQYKHNIFRLKRGREVDIDDEQNGERDGEVPKTYSSFCLSNISLQKRVCTSTRPESMNENTLNCQRFDSDDYPMKSIDKNLSSSFAGSNMDQSKEHERDEILTNNFNTISLFNNSNKNSLDDNIEVSGNLSSHTTSPYYPVFSQLKRAGRRIDHAVDEVIRKACRYSLDQRHHHQQVSRHDGSLQITIPAHDFEFNMPSSISVGGSPTRDARYISSPDKLTSSLALACIHYDSNTASNAGSRSYMSMNKAKLIQYAESKFGSFPGDENRSMNTGGGGGGGGVCAPAPRQVQQQQIAAVVGAPRLHLGSVSHSEWFRSSQCNNSGSTNCNISALSHFCRNEKSRNTLDTVSDDDEDCVEMFIDA